MESKLKKDMRIPVCQIKNKVFCNDDIYNAYLESSPMRRESAKLSKEEFCNNAFNNKPLYFLNEKTDTDYFKVCGINLSKHPKMKIAKIMKEFDCGVSIPIEKRAIANHQKWQNAQFLNLCTHDLKGNKLLPDDQFTIVYYKAQGFDNV